jgi:hypothetical protein
MNSDESRAAGPPYRGLFQLSLRNGINPQRACSPFLQAGRAGNTNVPYGFSW